MSREKQQYRRFSAFCGDQIPLLSIPAIPGVACCQIWRKFRKVGKAKTRMRKRAFRVELQRVSRPLAFS
jgi:hypothetical protein